MTAPSYITPKLSKYFTDWRTNKSTKKLIVCDKIHSKKYVQLLFGRLHTFSLFLISYDFREMKRGYTFSSTSVFCLLWRRMFFYLLWRRMFFVCTTRKKFETCDFWLVVCTSKNFFCNSYILGIHMWGHDPPRPK